MDVGNILSSSQLLQRKESIEKITSNAEKSSEHGLEETSLKDVTLATKEVAKDEAKNIVKSMNDFLKPTKSELKFQFHDKLDEYYVTIVNSETDEVLREIPPKKMLDIYAAMAEFMGFIVDEKV